MKKYLLLLTLGGLLFSCEIPDEEEIIDSTTGIMPSEFKIDIPDALNDELASSFRTNQKASSDTIQALELYKLVRAYVEIGENSAEVVEKIMISLNTAVGVGVTSFTYTSKDDDRTKTITINQDVFKEGTIWAYEAVIKDQNGSKALQVFWNNTPLKGIAILSPYNIDRTNPNNTGSPDALYRIDYNTSPANSMYEATMDIQIAGLVVTSADSNAVDNFKMAVGRKSNGDVEVRGNSNHPLLKFDKGSSVHGMNYVFAGRGNQSADRAAVQIALPASSITTTTNLFDTYSIYNTYKTAILSQSKATPATVDAYLTAHLGNAKAPAYFRSTQFIGDGVDERPSDYSADFADLSSLTPFAPNTIATLILDFL